MNGFSKRKLPTLRAAAARSFEAAGWEALLAAPALPRDSEITEPSDLPRGWQRHDRRCGGDGQPGRTRGRCVGRPSGLLPLFRLACPSPLSKRGCEAVGRVVPQQWLSRTTAPGVSPDDRRRLDLVVYGATERGEADAAVWGILAVAAQRTVCQHRPGPLDVAAFACWRGRVVARGCPLAGRAQRPQQPPPPRVMVPVAPASACEGVLAGRPARRFTQPFHCSSHPRAPYGRNKKKIMVSDETIGFCSGQRSMP